MSYYNDYLPRTDAYGNRLLFERGIYVSKSGKFITKPKQGTSYDYYYKPRTEKGTGREYIINDGDRLYIDELVAACFLPKPPSKRRYKLRHKDGNLKNNNVTNLEWVPAIPTPAEGQYVSGFYLVDEDGNIFDDGEKMSVKDNHYDSDMDLHVTVRPYFEDKDQRRVHVDDVVAVAAGYIAGDRDALVNPVILHKDHDPMNYNHDNLEWVEKDSKEYQDYMTDYNKWEYNNNIRINPHKRFPDFMQPEI